MCRFTGRLVKIMVIIFLHSRSNLWRLVCLHQVYSPKLRETCIATWSPEKTSQQTINWMVDYHPCKLLGVMFKTSPKKWTFIANPSESPTPKPQIPWCPDKGEAAHGHNSSKVGLASVDGSTKIGAWWIHQKEGALIYIYIPMYMFMLYICTRWL